MVWNPDRTRVISAETHHHAVDFNIFEGMEVHGVAEWVITGGRVVVEDGNVRVARDPVLVPCTGPCVNRKHVRRKGRVECAFGAVLLAPFLFYAPILTTVSA